LELLRSGDEAAFAEFIDKYKETVFLCCRSLGLKEDEAEDVASETFLAAYQGLERYSGHAELSTWLWSIAYHQAVNYLRKNHRKWQLLSEPVEQLAESQERGPVSAAQDSEQAKIVWAAVKRLPSLWAMAIILYYREGKDIADTARIMRVRKNTVKTYLFRGREKLKSALSGLATTFGECTDVKRSIKR
jgi:RNA polymerase sigma-70 factor (ECF subfamily)